jgi:hypothetical protein
MYSHNSITQYNDMVCFCSVQYINYCLTATMLMRATEECEAYRRDIICKLSMNKLMEILQPLYSPNHLHYKLPL